MDPSLMQIHLKQNAENMQEYLKGLDNWEDDMKKRDQLLKKQKPILKKTLPPVRGRPKPAKPQVTKAMQKTVDDKQQNRITSFDYNAWSKFDVDAACEETPSSSSEEEVEEEEAERIKEDKRKKMADLEKERGNQLFKEGKYKAAVERYTKAIELDPTSHILPANRAMALIKLKQYGAAENDCNISIALEENYIKSWQRRATARTKLGKLQEALEDYAHILKMEPSSKTTITEIKKLKEQIAKEGKTASGNNQQETPKDPRVVFPVKRPPHLRSKKPLVRINIEEVGGEEDNSLISVQDTCSDQTLTEPSKDHDPSQSSIEPSQVVEEKKQLQQQQTAIASNLESKIKTEDPSVPLVVPSVPLVVPSVPLVDPSVPLVVPSVPLVVPSVPLVVPSVPLVVPSVPLVVPSVPLVVPSVPTSSIEFMSQWKLLKNDQQLLTRYFQAIPLSKYPIVLNQSLESSVFSDILTILQKSYDSLELLLDVFQWLTKVPRFNVAIMFLSKADKQKLTSLFERLNGADTDHQEAVLLQLAKQYSLKLQ